MKKTVSIQFEAAPNSVPVKATMEIDLSDLIPALPTDAGEYKLVVNSEGVSTWVPILQE